MFNLDLDTLNEDRLRKAVDPATYQMGQALFERGMVQIIDLGELTANCTVLDKRNHHVEFRIARGLLYMKCSCSHASRGLICEHDVAAWMGLRQRLIRELPAAWQLQIKQILGTAQDAPRRNRAQSYLLFFSLQPESRGMDVDWKIVPYTLQFNQTPSDLRPLLENDFTSIDAQTLREYVENNPDLTTRLRSPYTPLDAEICRNCDPSTVNLANVLLERNRSFAYAYNLRFPLGDYLALLARSQAPLFYGSLGHPLSRGIQVLHQAGQVRLNVDRDPAGLHLRVSLFAGEQALPVLPQDIQIILDEPLWVLADRWLLSLDNASNINLLQSFTDTPELVISPDQEADFIDQYLLDLARHFPLQGNAITWETVDIDPTPRLYLSEVNGELQGQLRFAYDSTELSYNSDLPAETIQRKDDGHILVRILRRTEAEKAAYDLLGSATYGMKRSPYPAASGLFCLRARTHPVDFLLNRVPRLAETGFEIYGEEQLKTARVNRSTPTISFRVSSGIDWFDVQTVVNFGELEVSLQDIRRALRKRERFIKLADGSIGEIPEEWVERYRHLFNLGEATSEGLRLSRYQVTLLDHALADADWAQIDAEFETRRARLRALANGDFQGIIPRSLPEGFIGELRPYQKAGYDWLHFIHDHRFGGCLADDMGLGKTVQALVFLQSLYERQDETRPQQASLLVVPRSLLVNWQREAARFTPDLRLLEFFETDRIKDTAIFDGVDLVITTYGVMLRDLQLLHSYNFHYAILDESQAIKNPLSQTARAAHLLNASHRLVLTGTPIENSTAELWSQFNFLNPGLLGNLQYFKSEFGLPIEKKNDEAAVQSLRRMVYPFILRRTKDQVAPELPPRTERILYCDMDPAQRKLYNRTRDYYRGVLLGMLDKDGLGGSQMKILEGLLRLRQISNHPILVDEKFQGGSAKFELLLETIETLRAENHKALIFSQFVQMLSLIRREMDTQQIPYTYLDGSTIARQEQVDAFQNNSSIPFFLISLKAGGLGLNLTAADYVIHIDPWWNPAAEMQASDRTHRIGQDKPVFVYKLIARDTVEEKILQLQERKRSLVDQIITTEGAFFKNLTAEDVKALFS